MTDASEMEAASALALSDADATAIVGHVAEAYRHTVIALYALEGVPDWAAEGDRQARAEIADVAQRMMRRQIDAAGRGRDEAITDAAAAAIRVLRQALTATLIVKTGLTADSGD